MLPVCIKNFYDVFPIFPKSLYLFFRSELVVPIYMILFPFVDFHFECNNSSTIRSESFVLIYMILFPFVDFHFEFNNGSTVRSELVVPFYMILFPFVDFHF